MNIAESFVQFLEDNSFGTLDTNIFIGGVPLDAPDKCLWVLVAGGSSIVKNTTGEKQKNYVLSVYYRNTNGQDVYDTLQEIEELLNANDCIELEGYEVVETEATSFNTDQDLDNEDRTVGLVQITITIHKV